MDTPQAEHGWKRGRHSRHRCRTQASGRPNHSRKRSAQLNSNLHFSHHPSSQPRSRRSKLCDSLMLDSVNIYGTDTPAEQENVQTHNTLPGKERASLRGRGKLTLSTSQISMTGLSITKVRSTSRHRQAIKGLDISHSKYQKNVGRT